MNFTKKILLSTFFMFAFVQVFSQNFVLIAFVTDGKNGESTNGTTITSEGQSV